MPREAQTLEGTPVVFVVWRCFVVYRTTVLANTHITPTQGKKARHAVLRDTRHYCKEKYEGAPIICLFWLTWPVPSIVNVFPEPVWPYAIIVALKPRRRFWISFGPATRYTWVCVCGGGGTRTDAKNKVTSRSRNYNTRQDEGPDTPAN